MLSAADVNAIESVEQLADDLMRSTAGSDLFTLEPEGAVKAAVDLNRVVRMARLLVEVGWFAQARSKNESLSTRSISGLCAAADDESSTRAANHESETTETSLRDNRNKRQKQRQEGK